MCEGKRIFFFAYPIVEPTDRPLQWFQLRDCLAFSVIKALLVEAGYLVAGTRSNVIMNWAHSHAQVDLKQFGPDDLIVITTRLPRDDEESGERPTVLPSHTNLEEIIMAATLDYLDELHRQVIELSGPMASLLEPDDEILARTGFRALAGGDIVSVMKRSEREKTDVANSGRTIGYLVFTPPLWEGGPRVLAIWGPSGDETGVWAETICAELPELVKADMPRFAMYELKYGPERRPYKPIDLSFAQTWRQRKIIDVALPFDPGPRYSDRVSGRRVREFSNRARFQFATTCRFCPSANGNGRGARVRGKKRAAAPERKEHMNGHESQDEGRNGGAADDQGVSRIPAAADRAVPGQRRSRAAR